MKHNNKFHTNEKSDECLKMSDKKVLSSDEYLKMSDIKYKCKNCNKNFNNRKTKWSHEKKCVVNNTDELKKENQEIKKELIEMKNMIAELLKTRKIHPKTLQKINNNLINNGYINSNNNTTIIKFGSININNVLTEKEVLSILYKPFVSTEECVKLIHFNEKRPQYGENFVFNLDQIF